MSIPSYKWDWEAQLLFKKLVCSAKKYIYIYIWSATNISGMTKAWGINKLPAPIELLLSSGETRNKAVRWNLLDGNK